MALAVCSERLGRVMSKRIRGALCHVCGPTWQGPLCRHVASGPAASLICKTAVWAPTPAQALHLDSGVTSTGGFHPGHVVGSRRRCARVMEMRSWPTSIGLAGNPVASLDPTGASFCSSSISYVY